MSITSPEPAPSKRIPIAGVDGGTETWHAVDDRFPVCGCATAETDLAHRWDWMLCRVCGLPVLEVMLRGRPDRTP